MGRSGRQTHAFGPNGWFQAHGVDREALLSVLKASGALRRLPAGTASELERWYGDPRTNRTFAFVDAVLGPVRAVEAMRRIRRLAVGIVGCGGIGSATAYLLAGLGVRQFVLVDPDRIEEGNLTRQVLYTLGDVGRPKVSVLSEALAARFRDMQLRAIVGHGQHRAASKWLDRTDCIVCGGDDPPTLHSELQASHPSVPVWGCGYAVGRSLVIPPRAPAPRTRTSETIAWRSVADGFAPSVGFQNFEIAARCVAMILLEHDIQEARRGYGFSYASFSPGL